MTAQLPDHFILDGERGDIVGGAGPGMFDPRSVGVNPPGGMNTACMRGVVCTYTLYAGRLVLDTMETCLGRSRGPEDPPVRAYIPERGPAVNGVEPEYDPQGTFNNVYRGLGLPVAYSGPMLVGFEVIPEERGGFGFPAPWMYRRVFQLVFLNGEMVEKVSRNPEGLR